MKKIIAYLNSIPKDKWQHFCLGSVIAPWPLLLVGAVAGFWLGLLISIAAVVLIAYAKEVWDGKNGGTFDWMDFWATTAGGAVIWLTLVIIRWML
jgi:hypothetical protein